METVPQTEERKTAIKTALVEAFMAFGLTREAAEVAAGTDEGQKIITVFNAAESWGR